MANLNAPRGFVPVRYLNGAAWNGATNLYFIPQADGSVYSPGDAVKSAAGGDANGVPAIAKAAGTDTLRGVITNILVAAPNNPSLVGTTLDLTTLQAPATKAKGYYALVVDDPAVLFEIQDDGASALTATACNKNASFTVANPTAPQQNSASVLGAATVNTTQALNLRILGLAPRDDNAFGVNARWLVKINQHELEGNTAGV